MLTASHFDAGRVYTTSQSVSAVSTGSNAAYSKRPPALNASSDGSWISHQHLPPIGIGQTKGTPARVIASPRQCTAEPPPTASPNHQSLPPAASEGNAAAVTSVNAAEITITPIR